MKLKKIIGSIILTVAAVAAVSDCVRYLKPDEKNKTAVRSGNAQIFDNPQKLIFVYNAYGGFFPGVADIIHKEFFPKTYPCNLCYQAFGTFGKKDEWKSFLETIPLAKEEFHKDDFRRDFQYAGELPIILIANNSSIQVLLSAAELNTVKTLEHLVKLTKQRLQEFTE